LYGITKDPKEPSNLEKNKQKDNTGGITIHDFTIYYRVTVIKNSILLV
jgi:hypothetical protein